MTRYFLNIRDGSTFIEDFEGGLFPNIEAAFREAMQSAREILSWKLIAGEIIDGQTFEIMDEAGIMRAKFPFTDAFRLS